MSPPVTSEREARRLAYAIAPGVLLAGVAGGIAFPVLPLIGLRAGLPLWLIGAILAANRAGRILASPFIGTLTDRIGGRRTLLAGLLLQVAVMGLYVLGVSRENPGAWFLLARLVHGPASACVFVAAQALALHAGGRDHGGLAAGTVRLSMSAGLPVGLAVGGLLSAVAGERLMFEAAMAAVAIGAAVGWWTVPDLRAERPAGAPPARPWLALASRRVVALGLLNLASFFSAQGVVLTTMSLIVHARGLQLAGLGDAGTAGLAMAWMVLVSSATMVVAGRLGDRHGAHARFATAGVVLTVPGLLALATGESVAGLAVAVALVGMGMGALGPALLALLSKCVAPEERGRASGLLQLFADVGGMLGPIAGTTLLAFGEPTPFFVAAAVMLLALPAALWLARIERRASVPGAAPAAEPPLEARPSGSARGAD